VCASNIGRLYKIPVQKTWFCRIPQYKEIGLKHKRGVLIQLDVRRQKYTKRNQFREDLIHGGNLISFIYPDFSELKNEQERRRAYTLRVVIESLRNYVKNNPDAEIIWEQFFELLVFDAIIGGTDRHYNNWGILQKADTGEFLKLSPAFDNGISLLWKIKEYGAKFLKEVFTKQFCNKAESMFKKTGGGKYTLYKVLEELYIIPEYRNSNLATRILKKICKIGNKRLKSALLNNIPLSKGFETETRELNLISEYVNIRIELLKIVLYKLSKLDKN
jgi:hypothetical protein